MPYEITIDKDMNRIEVRYHGTVDLKQRLQAVSEVAAIIRAGRAKKRFLIDVTDIHSELRTSEEYDLGTKLADTKEFREGRTAVLRKPGSNENEFIDTVASNRGYPLKEFTDRDEAIRWLQD